MVEGTAGAKRRGPGSNFQRRSAEVCPQGILSGSSAHQAPLGFLSNNPGDTGSGCGRPGLTPAPQHPGPPLAFTVPSPAAVPWRPHSPAQGPSRAADCLSAAREPISRGVQDSVSHSAEPLRDHGDRGLSAWGRWAVVPLHCYSTRLRQGNFSGTREVGVGYRGPP